MILINLIASFDLAPLVLHCKNFSISFVKVKNILKWLHNNASCIRYSADYFEQVQFTICHLMPLRFDPWYKLESYMYETQMENTRHTRNPLKHETILFSTAIFNSHFLLSTVSSCSRLIQVYLL